MNQETLELGLDDTDRLEIDGEELRAALRAVPLAGKQWQKAEVVLTYQDGMVAFAIPGMVVRAKVSGTLSESIRFPMPFLQRLATYPPKATVVRLDIKGDRLKIDGATVGFVREAVTPPTITLPINADLAVTLSVAYHYSAEEIEAAGLTVVVNEAAKRKERLIGEAHSSLREFGIKQAEIEAFVDAKMKATRKPW